MSKNIPEGTVKGEHRESEGTDISYEDIANVVLLWAGIMFAILCSLKVKTAVY